MSDLTLICENCSNGFVFSEGEQSFYASKGLATPTLCPICRSIKSQERKIPPKPTSSPNATIPSSNREDPKDSPH